MGNVCFSVLALLISRETANNIYLDDRALGRDGRARLGRSRALRRDGLAGLERGHRLRHAVRQYELLAELDVGASLG